MFFEQEAATSHSSDLLLSTENRWTDASLLGRARQSQEEEVTVLLSRRPESDMGFNSRATSGVFFPPAASLVAGFALFYLGL